MSARAHRRRDARGHRGPAPKLCEVCGQVLREGCSVSTMYLAPSDRTIAPLIVVGHFGCIDSVERSLMEEFPHLAEIHEHRYYDDADELDADLAQALHDDA